MVFRFWPRVTAVLVVIAVLLMAGRTWAHWYPLGPSKDEWGLKYDGKVDVAKSDKLSVRFTIAGQGRLKPIHSVFVMAFSDPDQTGTNLLKRPIEMKLTEEGQLSGQAEVEKKFADRAVIRIFTFTVNGRSYMAGPTAGARFYDVPLKKFLPKAPAAASVQSGPSLAPPPASSVAK